MQTGIGRYLYLFCFFDLPIGTKKERRIYSKFRKKLLDIGFLMLQYSVYICIVRGRHQAENLIKKIENIAPKNGTVKILYVTDKQYERMVCIENPNYRKEDEVLKFGTQGIIEF